uniref:Cyanobacterial aminoacyl-tRNA synthetase CAAD domain-containing protein n=2 Tax=Magnoliopsida TaxID=3398 RepID=A0A803NZV2_CANSA
MCGEKGENGGSLAMVDMASIVASLPPPLLIKTSKTLLTAFSKLPLSSFQVRQNRGSVAVKAAGDNSESSTSLTVTKSVQNLWANSEDRPALFGLGFAVIAALWTSINLVSAIDKLPVIPSVFEVVGILFSSWFIYRYLLFKPDRETFRKSGEKHSTPAVAVIDRHLLTELRLVYELGLPHASSSVTFFSSPSLKSQMPLSSISKLRRASLSSESQFADSSLIYLTPTISAVHHHHHQNDNVKLHEGQQLHRSPASYYASLLQSCVARKAINPGKQLHARLFQMGIGFNTYLATKLVNLYCVCESVRDAHQLFDKIPKRNNLFLWNVLIRGYAWNGPYEVAVSLYHQMFEYGLIPDRYTFPFVLKACSALSAIEEGRKIHDRVIHSNCEKDVFVGAALIDMYAKCGCPGNARQVFDMIEARDVVLWNSMLAAYSQNGQPDEALALCSQMALTGLKPTEATLVTVVSASADIADLLVGKELHGGSFQARTREE